MNRYSLKLFVVLSFLYPFGLLSFSEREEGPRVELGWQKALNLLIENNPELQSAQFELESSEYSQKVEFAELLPQVTASLGHSRDEGLRDDSARFGDSRYSASIALSQGLFRGGERRARIKRSEYLTDISYQRLNQTRVDLTYQLRTRFEGVLYAQRFIELAREILARRVDNVNLIELRYESGQEDKGSLLLSKANLKQSRFELRQAKDLLELSWARLKETLGVSQLEFNSLVGEVYFNDDVFSIDDGAEIDISSLIETIPAYKQSKFEVQASEKSLSIARSSYIPNVSLNTNINSTGESFFPDQTGRLSMGLSIQIPLFQGGRNYYQNQIAANNWAQSKKNLHQQKLNLMTELEQAYISFKQAVKRVEIEKSFLEAARLRAEISRTRYSNGLLSFEEWDRIENDFISREQSFLRVQRDLVLEASNWEKVQGLSLFNEI